MLSDILSFSINEAGLIKELSSITRNPPSQSPSSPPLYLYLCLCLSRSQFKR